MGRELEGKIVKGEDVFGVKSREFEILRVSAVGKVTV